MEQGRGYIHLGRNTSRQAPLLQGKYNIIILLVKFDCFKDTWRWIPLNQTVTEEPAVSISSPTSALKMFEIQCNTNMIIHTITKNSNFRRNVTFELKILLVKTSVYPHMYSYFTGAKS